jgi:hypothetical protein
MVYIVAVGNITMHVGMWSHPREVVEAQSYDGRTVQGVAMTATLDENYEPRPWRCGECRLVLGVVMRDTSRVRRLYTFFQPRRDDNVPAKEELWKRPRGMFHGHGVDWCQGVECPICGARSPWDLSTEIKARLNGELVNG